MNNYRDRLIAEKNELDERRDKLEQFLETTGSTEEIPCQRILKELQLGVMATYSRILQERIGLMKERQDVTGENFPPISQEDVCIHYWIPNEYPLAITRTICFKCGKLGPR